jgi:hypothetical protein
MNYWFHINKTSVHEILQNKTAHDLIKQNKYSPLDMKKIIHETVVFIELCLVLKILQ